MSISTVTQKQQVLLEITKNVTSICCDRKFVLVEEEIIISLFTIHIVYMSPFPVLHHVF